MFDKKSVIIFDVDGTLLDTIGMWNEVDEELIEKIGGKKHHNIRQERENFLAKNTSGDTYKKYAHYLKKRYSSPLDAAQIFELRDQISLEHLIHKVDFKEKAEVFIALAKKKGFSLAIASSTTKWAMDIYKTKNKAIINKCDIDQVFDLVLLKDDVKKAKPDPEVYLKVLDSLSVTAQDCIVLEDSLSGVIAAKRAGIEVINVYDKHSDEERAQILKETDFYVEGFPELIKAIEKERPLMKTLHK